MPVDKKLVFNDTISYPIKTYVGEFGAVFFYSVIVNANGEYIVSLDEHWCMGMADLSDCELDWYGLLEIFKELSSFDLCGGW